MREAVIVSTCRTAVGRAIRGSLRHTRPEVMGSTVLKDLLKRANDFDPLKVEDLVMGCAMPEAEQGMNIARQCIHLAGLPDEIPAMTINRYCSSGLNAISVIAERIMVGQIDVGIGAGTETMSMIPMGGNKIVPEETLAQEYPQAYVSMGETAENVAHRYNVSREEQDEIGVESNKRALEANEKGVFKEQITPLNTYLYSADGLSRKEFVYDVDEGPRPGTTMEMLAKLRPAFWAKGTVTAGNASQMSDGSSASLLMERKLAEDMGFKPMLKYIGLANVAFDPAEMGIGPALAIPRVLEKCNLNISDIDYMELNEAFASQAKYCVRELDIQAMWDKKTINANGGAIALGHPLGCTGAKLTTQLAYHMRDNNMRYGIVSMCIGGGMGAAGIFENLL
jgi:acetyl-CoA acyltransferase